jgi:hypothetical protein
MTIALWFDTTVDSVYLSTEAVDALTISAGVLGAEVSDRFDRFSQNARK